MDSEVSMGELATLLRLGGVGRQSSYSRINDLVQGLSQFDFIPPGKWKFAPPQQVSIGFSLGETRQSRHCLVVHRSTSPEIKEKPDVCRGLGIMQRKGT